MIIRVKAASALREHLAQLEPGAMQTGQISLDITAGTVISDVIAQLGIPSQKRLMVLLDGSLVQPAEYATTRVLPDQLLSLNPPIAAG